MPVITRKIPCTLASKAGNDLYGQPIVGAPRKTTCMVIRFKIAAQKTTVRADSSGTRGHADEEVAQIKVLLSKNEVVELDDIFTMQGVVAHATGIQLRFDIMGRIDHKEIEASIG